LTTTVVQASTAPTGQITLKNKKKTEKKTD
jgi:hypothetical protein